MQQITYIAPSILFYSSTPLSQNCVSGAVHQSEQSYGIYRALWTLGSNTGFIQLKYLF